MSYSFGKRISKLRVRPRRDGLGANNLRLNCALQRRNIEYRKLQDRLIGKR